MKKVMNVIGRLILALILAVLLFVIYSLLMYPNDARPMGSIEEAIYNIAEVSYDIDKDGITGEKWHANRVNK